MKLSILLFCFFHGTYPGPEDFCIYQPKTFSVKEGESVTIPCSYTHPEHILEDPRVIVTWGEADGINCSSITRNITDSSGNITDEYKDRISTVIHPDNRTASITIQGLTASDEITYCCRITIFSTDNREFTQYDMYGTSIHHEDGRSVSQLEELMAISYEEMFIPCHYPLEILGKALQASWYIGHSKLCENVTPLLITVSKISQFPLRKFPEDVSMGIIIMGRDNVRLCCHVTTRNGTIKSRFGTEVSVTDYRDPPSFTVTQATYNITGHIGESVTLNCSYSGYNESDVLWVNIYWRLGNITGPYVYHPYKEMVHPSYKGRTEIKGRADLQIRGLQKSDNSTYYCFVMLRMCTENDLYGKLVQYGEGTRLIVTGTDQNLVTIISISAAVFLVLLSLILVILKKTGVICKKNDVPRETFATPGNGELSKRNKLSCIKEIPLHKKSRKKQIVNAAAIRPDSKE